MANQSPAAPNHNVKVVYNTQSENVTDISFIVDNVASANVCFEDGETIITSRASEYDTSDFYLAFKLSNASRKAFEIYQALHYTPLDEMLDIYEDG